MTGRVELEPYVPAIPAVVVDLPDADALASPINLVWYQDGIIELRNGPVHEGGPALLQLRHPARGRAFNSDQAQKVADYYGVPMKRAMTDEEWREMMVGG